MAPDAGYNAANLLQVPAIEKNFLLSPPGSPPVGWVQPTGAMRAWIKTTKMMMTTSNKRNRISRDSLDSLESSSGRNSSSRNTTTTDSARSSERYTLEGTYKRRKDVEDRGVRVGNKTKHVLTFGPPSSHRGGDDGGMEWEVSLPIVVVEDHDYDEDEDEDANSSNVSLNRGISAFSMSVNEGEVYGSDESFDSGSEYSGRRTPLPRTALPPVLFQQ
ncbi:hypothetical protein BDR26DRAFT_1016723 [Obelidium mucronatum]|nr:hypothetical protein BDR26DRAFT_1016723 [Obelidium mucronatum]